MAITKAYLMSETNKRIPFMFNPETIEFSKDVDWSPEVSAGKDAPKQTFKSGGPVTFSINALFDSTESGSPITTITSTLFDLTVVNSAISGTKANRNMQRPPWVQFHWGQMSSVKAVITSLKVKFTYFKSDGTPTRAEVAMSFKQYDDQTLPRQNPTSGTPNPGQIRRLETGQYLDTLSQDLYGDSSRWRSIAEANNVDDPLALEPGRYLVIPELES